jgi:hypothetical protein
LLQPLRIFLFKSAADRCPKRTNDDDEPWSRSSRRWRPSTTGGEGGGRVYSQRIVSSRRGGTMSPFKKSLGHPVGPSTSLRFWLFLLSFLFVRFIRRYSSNRFFHIFPRFPDKNFRFAIRFEPLVNWILRVWRQKVFVIQDETTANLSAASRGRVDGGGCWLSSRDSLICNQFRHFLPKKEEKRSTYK